MQADTTVHGRRKTGNAVEDNVAERSANDTQRKIEHKPGLQQEQAMLMMGVGGRRPPGFHQWHQAAGDDFQASSSCIRRHVSGGRTDFGDCNSQRYV